MIGASLLMSLDRLILFHRSSTLTLILLGIRCERYMLYMRNLWAYQGISSFTAYLLTRRADLLPRVVP